MRKRPMENLVPPALAASAEQRARALQALLDEHGPEMDRRRELTPEVVDALVAQDMLRLLLPRSMGGQEIELLDYCRACEALARADASTAWFVNRSEEHTSELQSRENLVCRLLLEKKKKNNNQTYFLKKKKQHKK